MVVGDEVQSLIGKYDGTGHPWFIWATPVAPHLGGPAEPDDPAPYRTAEGTLSRFDTPARPDWVKGKFDDGHHPRAGRAARRQAGGAGRQRQAGVRAEAARAGRRRAARRWSRCERQRAEALFAWDRQFGRIMQKLKDTGQYDDTVIVFTSDNGYFMGEHRQRSGKIKPYEPSLRVPLVVAGPGIPHGVRDAPITTIDVTATILDLASASLPDVDGTSAVPAFAADRPWTVPVVTEGLQPLPHDVGGFPDGLTEIGLRTGRYAYFRYSTGEGELYDLKRDPLQLRSRYDDPAYESVRRDLTKLWRQYRACADRRLPGSVAAPSTRCRWPSWPISPLAPPKPRPTTTAEPTAG